jgi:hypothetical protein
MNPYESPAAEVMPLGITSEETKEIQLHYDVGFHDISGFNRRLYEKYGPSDRVLFSLVGLAVVAVVLGPDVASGIARSSFELQLNHVTFLISTAIALVITAGIWRWTIRERLAKSVIHLTTWMSVLLVGHTRIIGHFQLQANASEITEIGPRQSTSFPISRARKIVVSLEDLAIYVSRWQVILIPSRTFSSTEHQEQFLAELRQVTAMPVEYSHNSAQFYA